MARKRRATDESALTPEAKRVVHLLNALWDGNRAAMGRELNLSHGVVNQVCYGRHAPGRKFLNALAAHPKVNPEWLLRGEGQPLKAQMEQPSTAVAGSLPVLDYILPGPPADHPAYVIGTMQILSPDRVRSSRYLLRVQPHFPIMDDSQEKVAAGDLLLVETESIWINHLPVLSGRLVTIDIGADGMEDLQLGRAFLGRELSVDVFGRHRYRVVMPRPAGSLTPRNRGLHFEDGPEPEPTVSIGAIRGVVMLLLRM